MNAPAILKRLGLRTQLMLLNAVVVLALLALSGKGWFTSVEQQEALGQRIALTHALHDSKQADMLHDALRGHVLAALLVGQVPELNFTTLLRQVSDDVRGLDAALDAIDRAQVPDELRERIRRNRKLAEYYGELAQGVVQHAVMSRDAALASLPAFEEQFNQLHRELDAQSTAIGDALKTARAAADSHAEQARRELLLTCAVTILLASACVALITVAIRRRMRDLGDVAQAIAAGDLERRAGNDARVGARQDEIGELGSAVDRMASSLSTMIDTMRVDAQRASFGKQLAEALDMADREEQVAAIAARAMAEVSPFHAMELLVADSSRAQMERAAHHPMAGAAGCSVTSPYDCVAVRRGTVVSFEDSDALNACPKLQGRGCGRLAAVCVPVTFMGRALGVLHAAGGFDAPLDTGRAAQLGALGVQLGMRIGTVRAFEKTQIQASTDALTGLPNRRTIEQKMRTLAATGSPYAVVMCDLDRFKMLNDTYGHAAGDTALRQFAEVLRQSMRASDVAGRWGGEEFAFLMPGVSAAAAVDIVDRLRERLASTLGAGRTPAFTASFGVADSTMSRRAEDLIQLADVALYEAKASGRNRACIADPSAPADAVRHAEPSTLGIDQDAALAEAA